MAQIHKAEAQFEVKCNADKFYDIYRNKVIHLSKNLPEIYNSIQVLEGDGKSVGTGIFLRFLSVRGNSKLWKTKAGPSLFAYWKETFRLIMSLDLKLTVTPKATEGSMVKWYLEFEKKTQDSPTPDALIDLLGKITKALEVYLLKA